MGRTSKIRISSPINFPSFFGRKDDVWQKVEGSFQPFICDEVHLNAKKLFHIRLSTTNRDAVTSHNPYSLYFPAVRDALDFVGQRVVAWLSNQILNDAKRIHQIWLVWRSRKLNNNGMAPWLARWYEYVFAYALHTCDNVKYDQLLSVTIHLT